MSCRTGSCRTLILIFALFAMAILATTAFAQNNCLQDEYTAAGNTQSLQCTANDVRVAFAFNTRNLDGTSLVQCTPGQPLNFIADFLVQTSSNKTRSNIGLYFGVGDPTVQTQALTGKCSDNIIGGPGAYSCQNQTALSPQCGSSHYDELDTSQFPTDNCGDTSSTDPTVCLSKPDPVTGNATVVSCPAPAGGSTWPGSQVVSVEVDNLQCPNTPGKNVVLADCTSWQIPGKAIQCVSPGPHYPYQTAAIPGSPSKCNCSTVTLPIIVQSPKIAVTKNCAALNGTSSSFPGTTSCTGPDPGSSTSNNVTYTIGIDTSATNFGDIAIDQICDSAYGTVYKASGYTGAACNPSLPGVTTSNTTCGTTVSLSDVPSPGTSCTFQVFQAEATTVNDVVTVTGHGLSGGGTASGSSNVVNGSPTVISVTIGEDPTTGTITKAAEAITNACATVKYTTTVKNTSTSAAEETLTLSKLFDDGVDLSTTSPTGILGTTCGVATGAGTFAGKCGNTGTCTAGNVGAACTTDIGCNIAGAGVLPQTLTASSSSYTCEFAVQFCKPVGTVVTTAGTCVSNQCTTGHVGNTCTANTDCDITCTGITNTDTVTAILADDESNAVSVTGGSATANMCITGP